MEDNSSLRGKLSTLESQLSSSAVELKTQRDTIQRLMSSQQNIAQCHVDMDNIRLVSAPAAAAAAAAAAANAVAQWFVRLSGLVVSALRIRAR